MNINLNGISVLSAAKFFGMQMSQTVTRQRLIDDVFGLAVEFLYELLCWQIKENAD